MKSKIYDQQINKAKSEGLEGTAAMLESVANTIGNIVVSTEFIKFKNEAGESVELNSSDLVLKEHFCTTTGTSYRVGKTNWEGDADMATYIATITKEEFDKLRKQYPEAPVKRSEMD